MLRDDSAEACSVSGMPHVRSLILVRHGRTAYNAAHRLQGQIDIPLDAVGRWQAAQTGAALRSLYMGEGADGGHPLVICSDLGRAQETAHAFADPLGVEVHPDERVRERSFGEWEGLSAQELDQGYADDYRSWRQLTGGELKHGAEPKEEVARRGLEAITDWVRRAGDNTDLYLFSHGAFIGETLQMLLGLDRVDPAFGSLVSMRNAHWSRLLSREGADGTLVWRLADYNHGPALADSDSWETGE
ncbi:phosphoglycerate mutase [Bifidobacterium aemilianum]|uniref:Phosphoglycerate mutase n=1 Tax=Bifidobacterium aemilianum TaxID=2493120 RepID=A0A366KBR5_9BIFI|nr:histidine phosphatase family protein [Bifidobacterium aemilianum]RBP98091.1 phosphoglycerate mutase [Bifidobacterium aemilianum]